MRKTMNEFPRNCLSEPGNGGWIHLRMEFRLNATAFFGVIDIPVFFFFSSINAGVSGFDVCYFLPELIVSCGCLTDISV